MNTEGIHVENFAPPPPPEYFAKCPPLCLNQMTLYFDLA